MNNKDYFTQKPEPVSDCSYPNCNCQMFCRVEMLIPKDL